MFDLLDAAQKQVIENEQVEQRSEQGRVEDFKDTQTFICLVL